MWLFLALTSACLLGFYDVSKKVALRNNNVLIVLFSTVLITSIIFVPLILLSTFLPEQVEGTMLYIPAPSLRMHLLIGLKAIIVLCAWILGYMGIKHLPITIVGPINATRPILVLVGAMLLFGERLNLYQWSGIIVSIFSLFLLSRSSRKEGISWTQNKWLLCVLLAAVFGAISGLYDKKLLRELPPLLVQSWNSVYQLVIMTPILLFLLRGNKHHTFHFSWAIPLIAIFLSLADMAYYIALKEPEAMISIISMIRRGSVLISFIFGAFVFGEKNLRAKLLDLVLILIGMVLLFLGSL